MEKSPDFSYLAGLGELLKTEVTTTMKRYFGVKGSPAAWVIHQLLQGRDRALVVTPTPKEALQLQSDLSTFGFTAPHFQFPPRNSLPYELVTRDLDVAANRNWCLAAFFNKEPGIFVASVTSLVQKFLPLVAYRERSFPIYQHSEVDRDALYSKLLQFGFLESSNVEEVGEVAKRGGVIDIFPSHTEHPIRIEIVGNIVQQIKYFSQSSQRSLDLDLPEVTIHPVREHLTWEELSDYAKLSPLELQQIFKEFAASRETPPRESSEVLQALQENLSLPGLELYQHILPLPWGSWLDVDIPTILMDEIELFQEIDRFEELHHERETRLQEQHYLIPKTDDLFLHGKDLVEHLQRNAFASVSKVNLDPTDSSAKKVVSYSLSELTVRLQKAKRLEHAYKPLADLVAKWRNSGMRVAFTIGSAHRASRLRRILLELDIEVPILEDATVSNWIRELQRTPIAILSGQLTEGMHLPEEKIVVVSEREIFGEVSKARTQQAVSVKKLLNSLSQLRPGDFVVHVDYGVGKYHGFTHREINGFGTDLLQIEYADSTLFLPMTNIAKVQRYSGVEGQAPNLDKLSSQRWQKTKAKVRKSVEYLAGDLVTLYAARKVAQGWRFDPSGAQDEEFADGFPFQETTDQMQAIEETLADMAKEQPMDRLICGDVGFGKTEVALRAAYKATQHAKQVAVLCPTTILVEQHLQNFQRRLSEFPVRVGAVSRFYSSEQNKNTLETLRTGELDIIIGTHKLLQRDIEFKDLGLLIIDEEHRFGVKQKERIKQFKSNIDVLTLTATPIPRTLHMSLLQLRDISIISTAPTDRRTVRTLVTPEDENTVRDALLRELERGGQAFFVHNRVKSIALITEQLHELLPDARIVFAHGQMHESQLEEIMLQFLRHEIDVLVSTTIIESGIDIPNANTMIIDRADTFGLAQLYQLRGRVGRSDKQAYCYFLTPKKRRLSREAQERLRALQSLDELGIGFQLAVRDLEIRGAGNLLGKEQSGNVISVGFELYTKILDEAIHHLTGDELSFDVLVEPEVKFDIDAYIPEEYIPDVHERMVIYQRMSGLRTQQDAEELSSEMEDRFGVMQQETATLIQLMTFRGQLKGYGVTKCDIGEEKFTCSFSPKAPISAQRALELIKSAPKKYKLSKSDSLTVQHKGLHNHPPHQVFKIVLSVLDDVTEHK
ncbi:MAG: transcription-repair coupling factor [Bdellovibrionales bacterium]|nr:transcription-repair coupling factor [Bdellovibrionales bacterium]